MEEIKNVNENNENQDQNKQSEQKQTGNKTFDDILKEKEYQSEFDKRVSKALETAKSKWQKELEVQKSEAEKLAQMNAEQKAKYELEKVRKEADEYKKQLESYELQKTAYKIAEEKEIPTSLLNLIDYKNVKAEDINEIITNIDIVFKKSIEETINNRFKEATPKNKIKQNDENGYLNNKYKDNPYFQKWKDKQIWNTQMIL